MIDFASNFSEKVPEPTIGEFNELPSQVKEILPEAFFDEFLSRWQNIQEQITTEFDNGPKGNYLEEEPLPPQASEMFNNLKSWIEANKK